MARIHNSMHCTSKSVFLLRIYCVWHAISFIGMNGSSCLLIFSLTELLPVTRLV